MHAKGNLKYTCICKLRMMCNVSCCVFQPFATHAHLLLSPTSAQHVDATHISLHLVGVTTSLSSPHVPGSWFWTCSVFGILCLFRPRDQKIPGCCSSALLGFVPPVQ